jgi:hypothetical protein
MTLSTGSARGRDSWRVPVTEFADTWIGPPTNFSGAVDVTVELHLADQSIADRRQIRLEWAAPSVFASADPAISSRPAALAPSAYQRTPRLVDGSENSPKAAQGPDTRSAPRASEANSVFASADPSVVMQSPSALPAPTQVPPAPVVASAHPAMSAPPAAAPPAPWGTPGTPQLDREQVAILVERGKHLIASGDLAAARVVLRRAAESRDAAAALALGSTYDPVILRELKTFRFAPDLELARGWYEKAKELGSEEAHTRIQMLTRLGW